MPSKDKKSQLIVIKIGTNTLSSSDGINSKIISKLCDVIEGLKKLNHLVILVSSGAVALGFKKLGLDKKPNTVTGKQVCASVGQTELIKAYEKFFSAKKIVTAQILLTRDGFHNREHYVNARETLMELLELNVVPIINENDAVASEEIKFSDNDMLAAMVSDLVSADRLIILTDEKGLYDKNPKINKSAKLIHVVEEVTPRIEAMASGAGSEHSVGGMLTKVQAAKLASASGIITHVILGKEPESIFKLLDGEEIGTTFLGSGNKIEKRKRWIVNGLVTQGKIYVDRGCHQAIVDNGKSLLPSGIKQIMGTFNRGAAIEIIQQHGNKAFAKGITNYGKNELEKIVGLKSSEIQNVLGYTYGETVIHRDDLVLI